ncbi:galactosylgalactosylxylosyl 3-beta-glucuronosyltransferase I-like [Brachionus plicatilis]|uniref:Galactosylgalactosylxylosylprotein 3-beta-glucuronosyltransferase n=1 Tax=Brachionus plicatilis TaxID=10195 RepID=A0A3M7RAJ2_BRAPC|nr:galactosylgalactosylxylosyl 3-beta-glucuronosyltransferase I-like [Brachionus plicatilis]
MANILVATTVFLALIFVNLQIKSLTNITRNNNESLLPIREIFQINYLIRFKKLKFLPKIFIITPTYNRITQLADLSRFGNTLKLVPKILWIVVEDAGFKSERIGNFLNSSAIQHVHLNIKSPWDIINPPSIYKGVIQRNLALDWIRENNQSGIVYFADDDNSYDIEIFEEIRSTKLISAFPVGLVGGLYYEKPKCLNNKIVGWFAYFLPKRKFPFDMASFAVSTDLLHKYPEAKFTTNKSYELEGSLLIDLKVKANEIEPKANCCRKLLVWHSKTLAPKRKYKNQVFEQIILDNL